VTPPPSGAQYHLRFGDQEAVIAEVGASLRIYRSGGADVVRPYDEADLAPAFSGMVLAPWPNRLANGLYEYDGAVHQVAVNETSRMTALHGLVTHVRWQAAGTSDDGTSVELTHTIVPTAGYPWPVRLVAGYSLGDEGLRATITATNAGDSTAPYGVGVHPWLSTGGAPVDACTLRVDAARHVVVDNRLLPTGTEPVSTGFDLREPKPLVGRAYDDAWTDLVRDGDGRSWLVLGRPDGTTVALWADEAARAWQVCTGDDVESIKRTAVAAEPMTCVADAFRTGDDLVELAPGASHTLTWGLALR
jgi:aldose 1-epimerase